MPLAKPRKRLAASEGGAGSLSHIVEGLRPLAVAISELSLDPRNARKHGDSNLASIKTSLARFGQRKPVVVNRRNGQVEAGNGTVVAAKSLGWTHLAAVYVDDDPQAQSGFALADNRTAELAEWDDVVLQQLLSEVEANDSELFDALLLAELAAPKHADAGPAEPQLDRAAELRAKWDTAPGQLWKLGNHRLLCGDSRQTADVRRLLGSDVPPLMVTDPPYGVEYNAEWRKESGLQGGGAYGKVQNDGIAEWTETWKLFPGDVVYCWHAGIYAATVCDSLEAAGFEIRSQIIWAKSRLVISRGNYHWQHEPCWYAVRKGKTARWAGDRKQSTLWEIDKPAASETGHSTQKPIECMARPITNNSKPGELIYEPFSGSGTTIIACEQLRRCCRAIEIDPGYVAVDIQRWVDTTGGKPVRID